ncbi:Sphinganine C(4)-monooxygenase 2 [Carex littledalei]|uniref:Sphinganine C(4)-monooxygenase 2 n=1 Tax=Carex littledalei TaxID=544730 RepID=A0A833VHT4_9POAL|nr:Sphinganine C(4)-monooxygenase 2 [Carex littledalei]
MNKLLYKHIHSKHHILVVPYAFGAIYKINGYCRWALAFLASGMMPHVAYFFSYGLACPIHWKREKKENLKKVQ